MWLIAETTDGNRLEYWAGERCILVLNYPDGRIDMLEALKQLMNKLKIEPVVTRFPDVPPGQ